MQNQALVGFVRGAVYVAVVAVVHFVAVNLGASGLVSGSLATLLTSIFAAIDHNSTLTP